MLSTQIVRSLGYLQYAEIDNEAVSFVMNEANMAKSPTTNRRYYNNKKYKNYSQHNYVYVRD